MPEINLKDISPTKKEINVKFSAKEVKSAIDESLKEVQKTAAIHGFRRGKAPMNMIRRKYMQGVKEKVKEDFFEKGYVDAVVKGEWRVLKLINTEVGDIEEGKEFSFTAEVEIAPKVENLNYTYLDVDIEKEPEAVKDEEIEKVIEKMRRDVADVIPVEEDREVKSGDVVNVNIAVEKKDAPGEFMTLYENQDVLIEDDEAFHTELKKSLIGKKPGDEYELEVDVDKEKEVDETRDKVKYKTQVNEIKQLELPEIDEEFAKRFGFEKVESLKNYIKEMLKREKEKTFQEELTREILDALITANPVEELPEVTTKEYIEEEYKKAGIDTLPEERKKEAMEKIEENVRKGLRETFIVLQVAEKENISVSDSEVDQFFEEQAQYQAGQISPEQLRQLYAQSGLINKVRSDILYKKVVDRIKKLLKEKKEETEEKKKEKVNEGETVGELPGPDSGGTESQG